MGRCVDCRFGFEPVSFIINYRYVIQILSNVSNRLQCILPISLLRSIQKQLELSIFFTPFLHSPAAVA